MTFQKGNKITLGKKLSEEHKRKISEAHKKGAFVDCLVCGNSFWQHPWEIKHKRRKTCSKECSFKYRTGRKLNIKKQFDRKGENNPNWRGGVTPVHLRIRTSLEYKLWRRSVFERDSYTCIWCGVKGNQTGGYLQADHIKPFAFFPELRFAIDNGRTLCKNCHKKTNTYARNKPQTNNKLVI